jgi:hypothetical protein
MSDSPALHSKWLLLQKIEISFVFNIRFITNQNELMVELSDTILKWDYPRTIPARFGLI